MFKKVQSRMEIFKKKTFQMYTFYVRQFLLRQNHIISHSSGVFFFDLILLKLISLSPY